MQPVEPVAAGSPSPRARRLAIGILILAALFTYLPSLRNGFVDIDDGLLITKNAIVLHLTPQTLWASFTSFDPELYVPLTFVSYQLEAAIFGVHPFVFHLTNLLLHMGTALLVFAVVRRLAARRFPDDAFLIGFFCAIVFAIHPLNTEAVVWAAARKDVLSSFFFFASLLFFLTFRTDYKRRTYVWSIVFFVLALLSKVSVLMLPFILLLVDAGEGRCLSWAVWKEKIPFFGLSLLFGLIALFGKQTQLSSLSVFEKGLLACKAAVFYLFSLLWPTGLTIFHLQQMPLTLSQPDLWAPPLIVLALLIIALFAYRRHRSVFFGIAFYLILLLPSFITFWKNGFVYFASERYAYVPMVGILFALGTVVIPPLRTIFRTRRIPALAAGIVLFVILSGLTMRQSLTWHDPVALNERALLVNSRSAHALNNLGSANFAAGKYREALSFFDRALAIDPALPAAHANRAQTLLKLGDTDGALKAYAQGIESIPKDRPPLPQDLTPFLGLAELLDILGRSQEAAQILRGAIQRLPEAPLPHYYLGVKEQQFGHLPEALMQFQLATKLDPRLTDAFYRLAAVSAEMGQLPEAIAALERVLVLDPGNELARQHLKNIKNL